VSGATLRTASRPAMADRSEVFLELIKPRITVMVLLTVAVGYFCAIPVAPSVSGVLHVLLGTALSCSGSGALNQYLERDVDLFMDRTRFRPLPAQRISSATAALIGALLSMAGVLYLAATVNVLAAALNALTVLSYLFLYTPMKRVHPLSTLAGAVPGALPPVIGWAAASGEIGAGAVVLFAILFLWQVPHFLAIGWMYREDYAKAGFPMLVVLDRDGDATARLMLLYAVTLLPVSWMLIPAGAAGHLYFWCAAAAGLHYVRASWIAGARRTRESARSLLLASVVYLPALFGALFLEHLAVHLKALW
jgi:protoheme IX farnesyltransferase